MDPTKEQLKLYKRDSDKILKARCILTTQHALNAFKRFVGFFKMIRPESNSSVLLMFGLAASTNLYA